MFHGPTHSASSSLANTDHGLLKGALMLDCPHVQPRLAQKLLPCNISCLS